MAARARFGGGDVGRNDVIFGTRIRNPILDNISAFFLDLDADINESSVPKLLP